MLCSPPTQRNPSSEWATLVEFVQRLAKMLTRLKQTKNPAGLRLCAIEGEAESERAGYVGLGGSCRQALCVFAHTPMAEMTPSLQGPQHACAISEFHTPAPPLWAQLLLRGLATQRTQPQLVYSSLLSQIKWSPHIKVNSLWNCTQTQKTKWLPPLSFKKGRVTKNYLVNSI